jgi:hypothetical protein
MEAHNRVDFDGNKNRARIIKVTTKSKKKVPRLSAIFT